ncbi:MAG: class I SAM-dependent methyltransferase [Candidatus Omnitrophota bacterium]
MVCNHQDYKEIYRFDTVPLYRCDQCGITFTDKHQQDFDSKIIYEEYYKNEMAGRFSFGIEYIIRLFRFFRAFKIFTAFPHAKSILDIGSGRGFMLYYLRKYYKYQRTVGTQISKNALEFSRDKLRLEIYDKDLLELSFKNSSFDIVTMWHVLEHVAEPEKYIEKISVLLKDRGRLIIEVPNFNSWTRHLTGKYWLGLDLDYHITFFTSKSLSRLLEKYNFKIKNIHTFSLEYSIFISIQSFVSFLTRSNHIFFQCIQTADFSRRFIFHAFIFILLAPVCFLVNILLYFSKRGEVLLIIAEKSKNNRREN